MKLPKWYSGAEANDLAEWLDARSPQEMKEIKSDFENRSCSTSDYHGWPIEKLRFEAMRLRTRCQNLERKILKLKSERN